MKNGWVIECPRCGTKIDEFSFCDEWHCEVCGEWGNLDYEEEDEDEDS